MSRFGWDQGIRQGREGRDCVQLPPQGMYTTLFLEVWILSLILCYWCCWRYNVLLYAWGKSKGPWAVFFKGRHHEMPQGSGTGLRPLQAGIFQGDGTDEGWNYRAEQTRSWPGLSRKPFCRERGEVGTLSLVLFASLFLSQAEIVTLSESVRCSAMFDSLWPHGLQPARLLCPWGSPGKNTGVGCHFLLQGIFLTQGLNPGLLLGRQILYHLS